jgi:hypothetical protein
MNDESCGYRDDIRSGFPSLFSFHIVFFNAKRNKNLQLANNLVTFAPI